VNIPRQLTDFGERDAQLILGFVEQHRELRDPDDR
jgi:hypothetical protein